MSAGYSIRGLRVSGIFELPLGFHQFSIRCPAASDNNGI